MAYSNTGLTDIRGVGKTGGHRYEKPLRNRVVLAHAKGSLQDITDGLPAGS